MFKDSFQDQMQLLPSSLEEHIEADHLARFVNMAVEELDTSVIEDQYSEKGQHAYHPKMLLKILIYGYAIGIRSSRKISRSCREHVVFMWLSGRQAPDFRTVSDFRSEKLENFKKLFRQVLVICSELGMIRCGRVSLDGTKIRADVNRNKTIYRKVLKKREEYLASQVEDILKEAEEIDREEEALYGLEKDVLNTGKKTDQKVIQELVRSLEWRKKRKKKKEEEVEEKMKILEERKKPLGKTLNSYSTVDQDATMMWMKEEYGAHGYNIQLATEHQVILAYGVFQHRNDMKTLRPMRDSIRENVGRYPKELLADCGYGSRDNIKYLRREGQSFVIPYLEYRRDRGSRNQGRYRCVKKEPDKFWEAMKWNIWKKLESEEGRALMRRRGYDVEPTIADLKQHMGLRHTLLRGRKKVEQEIGIASLSHNIKKIRTAMKFWNEYLKRMMTNSILQMV